MLNSPQLLGWTAQLQGFNCWTFHPDLAYSSMQTVPIIYSLKPFDHFSAIFWQNLTFIACLRHGIPLLFPASSVPTFLHAPQQATVLRHRKRQCPPLACAVSPTGHSSSSQPLLTGHLQLILQGVNERSPSLLGSLPIIQHKLLGGRNHVTLIYCCMPGVYQNTWPFVGTQ